MLHTSSTIVEGRLSPCVTGTRAVESRRKCHICNLTRNFDVRRAPVTRPPENDAQLLSAWSELHHSGGAAAQRIVGSGPAKTQVSSFIPHAALLSQRQMVCLRS